MKYLIINADDFGYCPKRNAAIIDLFRAGRITSTSLLVNGLFAHEACQLSNTYRIPMGLHLNLTEGKPVTIDLSLVHTLVNDKNLFHGKLGLRNALEKGHINIKHIEHEIYSQLRLFQTLSGQIPQHIDSHQHIHVHPNIVNQVCKISNEFGVKRIRAPVDEIISHTLDEMNSFYTKIVNQTLSSFEIFDKYSLKYPSYFIGMAIMGKNMTLDSLKISIEANKNKMTASNTVCEFMCHPGFPSDPCNGGCSFEGPDDFSQSHERQHEYDLLSSNEFSKLLNSYNIELCLYNKIDK
ncbi:unnamed protein product [Didymodactylos carnosus]|uniref:Carbohydrate deacetylase n=1 Tax=Didymodactylos carnosus TaxID=1234261 RepID=A0A813Z6E6_9BILA|nr:unnamed protein product [Didymodactylos carnosus]CAF0894472.1 unnamed protein product [Didymodactylos carnosus]CAF3520858.1 unnamed protein product [Didymodactylos carnosus]CAF3678098.1 unnamed protein product [Didymodactylos carnosus]